MSLEIWTAEAVMFLAVGFMVLSWVFEPRRAQRASIVAKTPRKPEERS
jgi:hypothetical protein